MQTVSPDVWSTKTGSLLISTLILFFTLSAIAQSPSATKASSYLDPLPQDIGAAGLKQQLRKLQTTGRLMMVTAHPDDEDGGLLTLESRRKGVQTLLLTLTRGEGGQNKTGTPFPTNSAFYARWSCLPRIVITGSSSGSPALQISDTRRHRRKL